MNKIYKVFLSIIAGIDIVFYMFTPLIISGLIYQISGYNYSSHFVFTIALASTLFRSIKIGFLKR